MVRNVSFSENFERAKWVIRDNINFLATLCQHSADHYFAHCTKAMNLVNVGETPESCIKLFDRMLKKVVDYRSYQALMLQQRKSLILLLIALSN